MLFGFGSITKTFVAGIVLQLVEEKKLDLEDPLGKWLPQYPNIDANITVRQLLNHGSGLDSFTHNESYWSELEADLDRVWLPEDTLKYVGPPLDIGFAPPKYSNTNYILLGMIIEAITGNSLAHELQSRITGPLQLDSTYLPKQDFNPERWADSTNLHSSLYSSIWAAGAIASTPREIAKWSQTLYSGNFLQSASLESMLITEPRRIGRRTLPMGLGVWKFEGEEMTAWGHGGRSYPFISQTFYIPELGLSVAYSYSWTKVSGQPIPDHLVRTYIENRPNNISMCFDY
jgi:D-alanyl-D-alanine carboxypeptidase